MRTPVYISKSKDFPLRILADYEEPLSISVVDQAEAPVNLSGQTFLLTIYYALTKIRQQQVTAGTASNKLLFLIGAIPSGDYVYTLEKVEAGKKSLWLQGKFLVRAESMPVYSPELVLQLVDNQITVVLAGQAEGNDEELEELLSQINALQADKTALEQQLADKDAQISQLETQLSEAEQEVSELLAKVSTLQAEKAALQSQVTEQSAQITALNTQVSTLQNTILQKDAQIAILQQQLAECLNQEPGDTEPPMIVISSPEVDYTYRKTFPVYFSLSETAIGFAASDVVVTNGAFQSFQSSDNPEYDFMGELVPAAEGTVTVSVPAGSFTDIAGNANVASNLYSIYFEYFDYFLRNEGSDVATGGSFEEAFASFNRLNTALNTTGNGQTRKAAILPGNYEGVFVTPNGFNTYTQETNIILKCVGNGQHTFDNTNYQTSVPDSISFVDAGGSQHVKTSFQGSLNPFFKTQVKGSGAHLNNGFGTKESGQLYIYDVLVDGYFDGVSSHATSYIYAKNVKARNCGKSAYAMTGSSSYRFDDCIFEGKTGASLGAGYSDVLTTGILNDCEIFTPVGQSTTAGTLRGNTTFNRCKIGKLVQGTYLTNSYLNAEGATFNDCFFNIRIQQYENTTMNRCYGILTIRPRGVVTRTLFINNCAFKTGFESGVFVNFNFLSEPADIGGSIRVKDSIFINHTNRVFFANNTAARHVYINANWQITNNLFFGNAAIADAGITIIQNSVTADPLLVNPNTENQNDWRVQPGSPAIGAGTAGSTIGIGVVAS